MMEKENNANHNCFMLSQYPFHSVQDIRVAIGGNLLNSIPINSPDLSSLQNTTQQHYGDV